MSDGLRLRLREAQQRSCPLCREVLEPAIDAIEACSGCATDYHAECLAELGGCSTLGCGHKGQPVAEAEDEEEPESIYDEVLDALRARRSEDVLIRRASPEELARRAAEREAHRAQLAQRHRERRAEWIARQARVRREGWLVLGCLIAFVLGVLLLCLIPR